MWVWLISRCAAKFNLNFVKIKPFEFVYHLQISRFYIVFGHFTVMNADGGIAGSVCLLSKAGAWLS